MENNDEKKMQEALFSGLVASFHSSAMLFMGKVMNPSTGKIEKNLEAAHSYIEMLRMLREKTTGNLSPEESKMLGEALSNMQLNYVDEKERADQEGGLEKEQDNAGEPEAEASPGKEQKKDSDEK